MNAPNCYRILLIDTPAGPLVKVFASWSGGYLDGDSWKVNSGTEVIIEEENNYFFYGFSGSIYKLNMYSQGSLTSYAYNVYDRILRHGGVREITAQEAIDILKEGEID